MNYMNAVLFWLLLAYCQLFHVFAVMVGHYYCWSPFPMVWVVMAATLVLVCCFSRSKPVLAHLILAFIVTVGLFAAYFWASLLPLNLLHWLLYVVLPAAYVALQIGFTILTIRLAGRILNSKGGATDTVLLVFVSTSSFAVILGTLISFRLLEALSVGWIAFAIFAVQWVILSTRICASYLNKRTSLQTMSDDTDSFLIKFSE